MFENFDPVYDYHIFYIQIVYGISILTSFPIYLINMSNLIKGTELFKKNFKVLSKSWQQTLGIKLFFLLIAFMIVSTGYQFTKYTEFLGMICMTYLLVF